MLAGLVGALTGRLIETVKLKSYAIAIYAVAALFLGYASLFALLALRHWIAVAYATQYPDLWIAVGFVLIAAVTIGVGYYVQTRKPKTAPLADIAMIAGPPALKLIARRTNARAVAVVVVLAAGVVLGRKLLGRRPM